MIGNLATIVRFTSILVLLGPTYISAQQKTEDSLLPPQRAHHSLAFDAKLGEVVLYGGSTVAENDTFTFLMTSGPGTAGDGTGWLLPGFQGQTWQWDGSAWSRISTTGPPPRMAATTKDTEHKTSVVLKTTTNVSGK